MISCTVEFSLLKFFKKQLESNYPIITQHLGVFKSQATMINVIRHIISHNPSWSISKQLHLYSLIG